MGGENKCGFSKYSNRVKSLVCESGFAGNALSPPRPFVFCHR